MTPERLDRHAAAVVACWRAQNQIRQHTLVQTFKAFASAPRLTSCQSREHRRFAPCVTRQLAVARHDARQLLHIRCRVGHRVSVSPVVLETDHITSHTAAMSRESAGLPVSIMILTAPTRSSQSNLLRVSGMSPFRPTTCLLDPGESPALRSPTTRRLRGAATDAPASPMPQGHARQGLAGLPPPFRWHESRIRRATSRTLRLVTIAPHARGALSREGDGIFSGMNSLDCATISASSR